MVRPPSLEKIPLTPHQVLLVRHGATAWSKDGRHTGTTDLPLLPEGETEARALHTKLSALVGETPPGLVLSSPLTRSLDTARLAGYDRDLGIDDNLVEWDYGLYEGRTTREIQAERSGWELFRDGCPGGETAAEVARRVGRVIDRMRSNHVLTGRPAILFAHGHVLRVLASMWAGFGKEGGRALPFETGHVGVLGWSHDDPALVRWNV